MFSHALVLYQSTLLNFTKKSAQAYATIANSFKGYQRYDFMVVKELVEPSTKLAKETGGDEDENKDKLLFFDEYHDSVEEAQEAKPTESAEKDDDKLLDFGNDKEDFKLESIDLGQKTSRDNDLDELFGNVSQFNYLHCSFLFETVG